MDPIESQNARDARVEQLWRRLDTEKKGGLKLKDLQMGLRKIDHRERLRSMGKLGIIANNNKL